MPGGMAALDAGTANGMLVIPFGVWPGFGERRAEAFAYDPAADKWRTYLTGKGSYSPGTPFCFVRFDDETVEVLTGVVTLPVLGLQTTGPAGAAPPAGTLALGASNLSENRDLTQIAAGVTLTTITRGAPGTGESWALYAMSAQSGSEAITTPRFADVEPAVLGHRVPVGSYRSLSEARDAQQALTTSGVRVSSPRHTSEDASRTNGPWKIRVLTIDPRRARWSSYRDALLGLPEGHR